MSFASSVHSFFDRFENWLTALLRTNQPALPLPPHLILGTDVAGGREIVLTGLDFTQHKHIVGLSGFGKSCREIL